MSVTLNVGDLVPDIAALAALPVGAAVSEHDGRKLWTKHGDGAWARHQDHANRYDERRVWFNGQRVISLPPVVYAGPMPGDVITTVDQLAALPIHATIALLINGDACAMQKWENGRWGSAGSQGYLSGANLIDDSEEYTDLVVASLPEVEGETVEQFAWRFRDLAITGSERARGYPTDALTILGRIGSQFTPSPGMVIVNEHDKTALPEGTRVYVGNPDEVESFGVFVKEGNAFKHIFGDYSRWGVNPVVKVDALPDAEEPAEWLTRTPTDKDVEAIAVLKANAWKHGFAEKQSRGWCEEFERIMIRGGVSAESAVVIRKINGFTPGTVLSVDQVASLPVGTHLAAGTVDQWSLFVRVDNATNKAGTRLVVAYPEAEKPVHFAKEMTLASGGARLDFRVMSHGMMDLLPIGAVVIQGGSRYQKCANERWGQQGAAVGQYPARDFGNPANNNMRLVGIE